MSQEEEETSTMRDNKLLMEAMLARMGQMMDARFENFRQEQQQPPAHEVQQPRGARRVRNHQRHPTEDDETASYYSDKSDSTRSSQRRHRRGGEGRDNFGGLKLRIPPFNGKSDPDAYLEWEKKIELVFNCQNYTEINKVRVAATEFSDYALSWWDQLVTSRRRNEEDPVSTWTEMKRVMRKRFVPIHHHREQLRRHRVKDDHSSSRGGCYSHCSDLDCGVNMEHERKRRVQQKHPREVDFKVEFQEIEEMLHKALLFEPSVKRNDSSRSSYGSEAVTTQLSYSKDVDYDLSTEHLEQPTKGELMEIQDDSHLVPMVEGVQQENVIPSECLIQEDVSRDAEDISSVENGEDKAIAQPRKWLYHYWKFPDPDLRLLSNPTKLEEMEFTFGDSVFEKPAKCAKVLNLEVLKSNTREEFAEFKRKNVEYFLDFGDFGMKRTDKLKTTSKTRSELFEWLIMIFGLSNTPSIFKRLKNQKLHNFAGKSVVVYTGNFLEYHKNMDGNKEKAMRSWFVSNAESDKRSSQDSGSFDRHLVQHLNTIMTPNYFDEVLDVELKVSKAGIGAALGQDQCPNAIVQTEAFPFVFSDSMTVLTHLSSAKGVDNIAGTIEEPPDLEVLSSNYFVRTGIGVVLNQKLFKANIETIPCDIRHKQGKETIVVEAIVPRYEFLFTLNDKLLYVIETGDRFFIGKFFKQKGFMFDKNKQCEPSCSVMNYVLMSIGKFTRTANASKNAKLFFGEVVYYDNILNFNTNLDYHAELLKSVLNNLSNKLFAIKNNLLFRVFAVSTPGIQQESNKNFKSGYQFWSRMKDKCFPAQKELQLMLEGYSSFRVKEQIHAYKISLQGEYNLSLMFSFSNLISFLADCSDLRSNPFQEGGDDMIMTSLKKQLEIEFVAELVAEEHAAEKPLIIPKCSTIQKARNNINTNTRWLVSLWSIFALFFPVFVFIPLGFSKIGF